VVYTQLTINVKHTSRTLLSLDWVPVAGSALVLFCMSFGLLPVIHILLGEIFPTDIRTTSIGIINALESIAFMVNIKLFPSFMANLGLPAIMYIYAGISLIMVAWGAVTIRKTDGLSLVETENIFGTVADKNNYGSA
jgi:MFS family permease